MDIRDVSTIAHSLRWTIPELSISQHIDCRIWLMFWFRCEIHSVQCRTLISVRANKCRFGVCTVVGEFMSRKGYKSSQSEMKWNVYTTRNDWISRRQTSRTNKRKKRKRNTQLKHWPIYKHKYIYLAREFIDQTIFPVFSNYSVEESEKPNKKWTKNEFMPLFERIDCKWSPYVLAFAVCINISLFPLLSSFVVHRVEYFVSIWCIVRFECIQFSSGCVFHLFFAAPRRSSIGKLRELRLSSRYK